MRLIRVRTDLFQANINKDQVKTRDLLSSKNISKQDHDVYALPSNCAIGENITCLKQVETLSGTVNFKNVQKKSPTYITGVHNQTTIIKKSLFKVGQKLKKSSNYKKSNSKTKTNGAHKKINPSHQKLVNITYDLEKGLSTDPSSNCKQHFQLNDLKGPSIEKTPIAENELNDNLPICKKTLKTNFVDVPSRVYKIIKGYSNSRNQSLVRNHTSENLLPSNLEEELRTDEENPLPNYESDKNKTPHNNKRNTIRNPKKSYTSGHEVKKYKCDFCLKYYKFKKDLDKHNKNQHGPSELYF